MRCIKCNCSASQKTLHRTTEKDNPNPEWMCESCIIKYHDKSLIDEGAKLITDIITQDKYHSVTFIVGSDNPKFSAINNPQFYCKKVCGDGHFSIKKWNEDFKMCNELGIEGIERDKILHPELFPCKKQCESCINIVIEQQQRTKNLIIFNELRKTNQH